MSRIHLPFKYKNHKAVDIIYLNFKRAFDSGPHKQPVENLRSIIIHKSVLKWNENWLANRRQRVVIYSETSNCYTQPAAFFKAPY